MSQVIEHKFRFPKGQDHLKLLIVPDTHHAPPDDDQGGIDPYAWSVFNQAAELLKPDGAVIIGDWSECTSVNNYQWSKKKRPPIPYTLEALEREAFYSQCALDELQTSMGKQCKQQIFIEGNHELWIDNLFVENPYTDPKYLPENLLGLSKRKIQYYKHGKWVKIGKCYYNHGTQARGVNHNRNMLLKHGKNLIYGHTHDLNAYAMPTLGGMIKSYSAGFLGLRDKDFLRGATTNWEHGFMTVMLHKTGYYTPKQYSINYGTTWVNGQRIKA
jgi:hypothetical protein